MSDIIDKVKKGVCSGCDNMLSFTDKPAERVNAEYLIVVSIAQSLTELLYSAGDPYRIWLEKSTKMFSEDCIPVIKSYDYRIKKASLFRKPYNCITRKGRIDIVIYDNRVIPGFMGDTPICAIEVKGFDPQKSAVISDLMRNLEYFSLIGNTGKSVVEFTLFTAMHHLKKTDNDGLQERKEKIKNKYHKYISEIGIQSGLEYEIIVFDISHIPNGRVYDYEDGYEVIDTDCKHHHVGVIVRFSMN